MVTAPVLFLLVFGLGLIAWLAGRARAWTFRKSAAGKGAVHSLPAYHGWYAALWAAVPAFVFAAVWSSIAPNLAMQQVLAGPAAAALPVMDMERGAILAEALSVATGAQYGAFNPIAQQLAGPIKQALAHYGTIGAVLTAALGLIGGTFGLLRLRPDFTARTRVERVVMGFLLIASLVAILTTLGIVASLVFEASRFFQIVSPADFLFGTHWSPDPTAAPGADTGETYGAIPLFWGTLFIGAIIAMVVAIPLGLMSAIYLTQYASPRVRRWMKPLLEILAGIPTVVYGYFAALTVAPLVRDFASAIGIANPSTESALAAGLVMGVMIIPFVSSMADDSIAAVPQAMRDGSLAMGATTSETIKKVLVPAALPGIVGGVMLAVSRAIGETMIVVMAAGAAANLTANPFESMTTVTYQIVQMLTGEQSFDHPATLSAFALGLVLFLVTLLLNIIALRVVKRYREAYE
ncbi:MAG TPA: phosphate ABC transporter permease subunit PstC [Novosphingobium sp.]|nr:phosphate ABC transporter permease subunit PstC [Novosphingobium sp.]